MDPDRYERAGELFLELAALEPGDRTARVAGLALGDAELFALVERLLASDQRGSVLDVSPLQRLTQPLEALDPCAIPGFRLVRRIGEGTSGIVFEAEQGSPRRAVALKVLRTPFASVATRRRFAHEADVLGWLHHPSIAQVHAAGTVELPQGPLPWFALELVDGPTLLEHCDRAELDRRARLELFVEVCDAVEHAHVEGVVHRDLKPQNIRVTREGVPKVLDFGVARVTGRTQAHERLTIPGQLVGTLGYMSPEQAAGNSDAVDARSDVYALGVILYEMLARRVPYDVDARNLYELLHAIRERAPRRLSAADRSLSGDLETIVAHALEKEPHARYPSARALAADVRAFLADRPIAARRASRFEHLAKFVRRNRALTAGALAAVLAVLVGLVMALIWERKAREAQELALAEAQRSRKIAYQASMESAMLEIELGRLGSARDVLEGTPVEERGFEWQLTRTMLEPFARVLESAASATRTAWFEPDGVVATLDTSGQIVRYRPDEPRPAVGSMLPWRAAAELAVSPDARSVCAVFPAEKSVRAFDLLSGEPLGLALELSGGASPPRWSGDGQRVVVHSPGETLLRRSRGVKHTYGGVIVFEPRGRGELYRLPPGQRIVAAALDGRGTTLAVGSDVGVLTVVDIEREEILTGSQVAPPLDIDSICFAERDELLAVACADDRVRVVERADPRRVRAEIRCRARPRFLTALDGGKRMAWVEGDVVRIAACNTGQALATLPIVVDDAVGLVPAPDGSRLVVVGGAGRSVVLETDTRDATTVLAGHASFVYAARFVPGRELVVSAGWDGTLRRWNPRTGEALGRIGGLASGNVEALYALALAPDSTLAAVGTLGHAAKLVDLDSGLIVARLDGSQENTFALDFDRTGRRLVVLSSTLGLSNTSALQAWDVERRTPVWTHEIAAANQHADLACARGQDWFALALDTQLTRQDLVRGDIQVRIELAEPAVGLALDEDDAWIAVGGARGTVFVCEAATLTPRWSLRGHGGPAYAVAFSPDRRRLATGADDGTVHLWDLENGREIVRFTAHQAYVHDLAFAPDGASLVSASGDGTLRVWDTRSERERRSERTARRADRAAASPAVERILATTDRDLVAAVTAVPAEASRSGAHRALLLEALWLALDPR